MPMSTCHKVSKKRYGVSGEGDECCQVFEGEYDEEGVYVYQAFCNSIADYALANQRLGGDDFNPHRMTWIKPSFAWVLYRSGYAHKHNQERILKIKLPHEALRIILEECACKHGGGGTLGRVQWDPARDLYSTDGKVPRKMLRKRAIQIGMKGRISKFYVDSILCIEDVTSIAQEVEARHLAMASKSGSNRKETETPAHIAEIMTETISLPLERPYMPQCSEYHLRRLGVLAGDTARAVASLGRGKYGM